MWGSVSKLGRQCYIEKNDPLGIEINIWEKNHRIEALAPKQVTLTPCSGLLKATNSE